VKTQRLEDPALFLDAAGGLLGADEARHNLIFGILATLRDDPGLYAERHLWLVEANGGAVAAALQTPPFNLVVTRGAGEALDALAGAIDAHGIELPGVTGAVPETDDFARAWERRTGSATRVRREQRIYALETVRPANASGTSREATEADSGLLLDWIEAFAVETGPGGPRGDRLGRVIAGRLAQPNAGFLLWEDGGVPVSLAGWGGPTPNGIRVGPVYTPPQLRRRGYAGALVADLSARQLAAGRRFCFLYTDAANPTANRIYSAIGYEHVCDSRELEFYTG
jgi:predicted GNAT family acetyltransferase